MKACYLEILRYIPKETGKKKLRAVASSDYEMVFMYVERREKSFCLVMRISFVELYEKFNHGDA